MQTLDSTCRCYDDDPLEERFFFAPNSSRGASLVNVICLLTKIKKPSTRQQQRNALSVVSKRAISLCQEAMFGLELPQRQPASFTRLLSVVSICIGEWLTSQYSPVQGLDCAE